MSTAGIRLRSLREHLGLTLRDVETASTKIAIKRKNDEFIVNLSRLSDIETKGITPNIFRLYSLSVIYRLSVRELMAWYGINLDHAAEDLGVVVPRKTHRLYADEPGGNVNFPVNLDPGFNFRKTTNFGRMIESWGLVPMTFLAQFADVNFTYGYIGSEDFTMYPLVMPGSFVQVDESKDTIEEGMWRSEFERPIYFMECRTGFICSWCSLKRNKLILQPHPLSPVPVRIMKYPQEAEVIGQVVGMAMQLSLAADFLQAAKGRR